MTLLEKTFIHNIEDMLENPLEMMKGDNIFDVNFTRYSVNLQGNSISYISQPALRAKFVYDPETNFFTAKFPSEKYKIIRFVFRA